ncbi:pyruvate dehydrogenase E1 component alpha subunit [Olsenella profusa DSM 13989]|uniref:TPP-dependent acetoin dehydrogenase complex, E1 component, alpha subunit n=1 Tax=Olsenella profusa F0195 TaxID=1125712 RepID=U2V010_9ACTN|nr:thiamine pyrophosphate-dependent dehydrogenase E1 component subunit alpha [Olsenella profusa]ERL06026.1 TPP-dependent acetoin dehydrogenase complex, E1 component, alpha subunit [Olsenella profusa F0195]MDP9859018.1 pyruvate dehydrogenase E1 component alpha subunit [Olsenella profusa DSM 13989]
MKVPTNEDMKGMYETLVRIRTFESRAVDLFAEGQIPGFLHSYLGEEAIATGVCANLERTDFITSTHRGHGHIIAKGGDTRYMMAELYGRTTGYCKGKGGSMHIADRDLGILGANGIVGAGQDIAVGAGLSIAYRGTNQVTACFFGDGSTNQGTFNEALNMASIWKLPIVFVCENNQFGISMSQSRHQAIKDIADRAVSYGFPGIAVDGNDVMAVYEVAREAVNRARQGQGPTLVECKTWRWRGHFEGDPSVYKDPVEQEAWMEKEPVRRYRTFLEENEVMTADEMDAVDKRIDDEIDAAVAYAQESPLPQPEDVVKDVYTDIVEEVRH